MKKKYLVISISIFLIFISISICYATSFTLESYDIGLNDSDPGLKLEYRNLLQNDYDFNLNLGESHTIDLFNIWTDETWINSDDEFSQDIKVAMRFSEPSPSFGDTLTGETFGVYSGRWWFNVQYGMIEWDGPKTFYFGPYEDGELLVSLSNEAFNKGYYGLNEGEKYGATIKATFNYAKSASVPEPASLLLLGPGLLGLLLYKRRNKSTN